jgi:septal ring factor EnvC (AmiA/AmiB activator)
MTDAGKSVAPATRRKGSHGQLRLPFFLLLTGTLLLAAGMPPRVLAADAPASPQQHEKELGQLRQRISDLQARITQTQGQRSALNRQLEQAEQQIGRLARGQRVLQGRLRRQNNRLQELRGKESRQQQALAGERELLAKQVRAAYAMGRQEQLKILLNQQDPATVNRVLVYYDYLNKERARRMGRIREQLDALAQTGQRIVEEKQRLAHLQDEQLQQKRELEQQQLARRDILQHLEVEIRGQGERLTQLRKDESQLQDLLRGLQEALLDIPAQPKDQLPFAKAKGRLRWPVRGVIRHAFGESKIGKLQWDGVMIEAPEGREVRAVHAGRVAFADWLRGFGLLLIIDHGDGYMTLYGHNQSLFKEAGDWVEAGEPIAAAGSTGGRKESGVYFAIRQDGKAVNPVKWCRRTRGRSVG